MTTIPKNVPVFEGLPAGALVPLLDRLMRRTFAAGATVIAEGDFLGEMYIVQAGLADVVMNDADGVEHVINRVGPGGTLGEIALITGQPHSASVRAAAALDVLVLTDRELREAATEYPELYRNLVAILSRRLVRSNRRAVGAALGRVTLLVDDAAPPLLGYALACSVAWHAQCPTLLLRLDDLPPPSEIVDLVQRTGAPLQHTELNLDIPVLPPLAEPRALILLASAAGAFARDMLTTTLDHLSGHYQHILVQMPARLEPTLNVRHRIRLGEPGHTAALDSMDGHETLIQGWSDVGTPGRPARDGIVRVPPLNALDDLQLQQGALNLVSRAGQALGWAARHVTGLKVGLAFGAGSARGYAHIGVLRVIDRTKLPVDYVGGTSIGAAVAAMFAQGRGTAEILAKLDWASDAAFRLALPTRGMLSSTALERRLRQLGGNSRIEELPVPLALTATDLNSRREVVFRRGLLWPAVLASLTIPGVYPAQRMGHYTLVDGGLTNPVPASAVADMGANVVIAVKLLGGTARTAEYAESVEPRGAQPTVLEVMMRSFEIVQSHIPTSAKDVATVVVAPEFESSRGLGLRNFRDGSRYVELGEAAAQASMPRLAAALPWLRG